MASTSGRSSRSTFTLTNRSFITAAIVGVLERLVRHHVAPVARRVADRQEDRLVLGAGRGERLVAPRVPVDRVVGVLAQVGAGLVREPVRHEMQGTGRAKVNARSRFCRPREDRRAGPGQLHRRDRGAHAGARDPPGLRAAGSSSTRSPSRSPAAGSAFLARWSRMPGSSAPRPWVYDRVAGPGPRPSAVARTRFIDDVVTGRARDGRPGRAARCGLRHACAPPACARVGHDVRGRPPGHAGPQDRGRRG